MKIADLISRALEQKGLQTLRLREAAEAVGISPELLRITLNEGHIPKDETLGKIAVKLGLDASALIMAAHQERVPVELKGFFLCPAPEKPWRKKRVFPLSEEQCIYLQRIMSPVEIQIVRKLRQVPEAALNQVVGYVDYVYVSNRLPPAPGPDGQGAPRNAGE